MRILVETENRLVVEHRPRLACAIMGSLGLLAVLAALHDLLIAGAAPDKDNLIGLVMGMVCLFGAVLFYRETITTFDRTSGRVTWHQRGVNFTRSDSARLEQIRQVVVGSHQSGGASRVALVLEERTIPLMFGFHGLGGNPRIAARIRDFLARP
jgi:fermentation-respiration switch protein FrsA (DUF1100 family)